MVAVLGSMLGLALGATPGFAADSGGVDAQVTVSTSAACIELSTGSVDFGTLALGAANQAGTPGITITNCGDADASLMASGTNAAGTDASWNLIDSAATCANLLGTDNYHLALATSGGDPIATLSTESKDVGTLTPGGTAGHVARISTACPGSSGAGQVMSMQINYLATASEDPSGGLLPITADQATADGVATLLTAGRYIDVTPTCTGNPLIACPGGVPSDPLPQVTVQTTDYGIQKVTGTGTETWAGWATIQAATVQGVPFTYSGVSCHVSVNTATAGSPTVNASWLQTFRSYPTEGGQPNYVAVTNVDFSGLDSGDIQIIGGLDCSLMASLASFFVSTFQDQLESYMEGNICRSGADGWMTCPPLP